MRLRRGGRRALAGPRAAPAAAAAAAAAEAIAAAISLGAAPAVPAAATAAAPAAAAPADDVSHVFSVRPPAQPPVPAIPTAAGEALFRLDVRFFNHLRHIMGRAGQEEFPDGGPPTAPAVAAAAARVARFRGLAARGAPARQLEAAASAALAQTSALREFLRGRQLGPHNAEIQRRAVAALRPLLEIVRRLRAEDDTEVLVRDGLERLKNGDEDVSWRRTPKPGSADGPEGIFAYWADEVLFQLRTIQALRWGTWVPREPAPFYAPPPQFLVPDSLANLLWNSTVLPAQWMADGLDAARRCGRRFAEFLDQQRARVPKLSRRCRRARRRRRMALVPADEDAVRAAALKFRLCPVQADSQAEAQVAAGAGAGARPKAGAVVFEVEVVPGDAGPPPVVLEVQGVEPVDEAENRQPPQPPPR